MFKKVCISLIYLTLILTFTLSAIFFYIFTIQSGEFNKIDLLEYGLKVDRVQLLPWKLFEVKNFSIAKDGLDVYMANLRLEWSLESLSSFHVEKLFVTKVLVKRLPESKKPVVQEKQDPIDIESLLKIKIPLHIDHIQVDDVKVLPFEIDLSFKASQSGLDFHLKELYLKQKENMVLLQNLKLQVQQLTHLTIEKVEVEMLTKKLVTLSKLDTKIDLVHLIQDKNLGQTSIDNIIVHSLPASPSQTAVASSDKESITSSPQNDFNLEEFKTRIDGMIPKELPVSALEFSIRSIALAFISNSLSNLNLNLAQSNLVSFACKIGNDNGGNLKLQTKLGLKKRSLKVDLNVHHWLQDLEYEVHNAKLDLHGSLNILFEDFKDRGSKSNLDFIGLYSQGDLVALTLPLTIRLNQGLLNVASPEIKSSIQGQAVTMSFLSDLRIHENLDLDLQRLLISKFSVTDLATIDSILVKASSKDMFQNLDASLNIDKITEFVSPVKGKIKSFSAKAKIKELKDLDAGLEISAIGSSIMDLRLIESKISGNLKKFNTRTFIRDFSSEDMGILTMINLKSEGSLLKQSATYSILGYKIKDSTYPEISGSISFKDKLLKGVTNLSFANLKPMDFQSFTNVPAKLKMKSTSEESVEVSTEQTTLPIRIKWKVQPLKDQIIHIVDEKYSLDVQTEMEYDSENNISGTIRILDGTLKYSDYDLRVLDTGYLTFHQKAGDTEKSVKSVKLSTTTTNYMDQLAYMTAQDKVAKSFILKDGIEVLLKLGMKWQDKDIVVKVSGIYPDMKIRLFDDLGKEIEGGFVGLLKGATNIGGGEESNEDLSKVLGDQVLSIANSKVDNYFNEKFKKQGIKIKTDFKPGETQGFGIQKKLGHRILLDYYRSQDQRDDQVTEMRKMQYLLKGSSSLYIRQDTQSIASESDMSLGVQRRIKF
ncbi:MAG: hypothetical protein KC646_11035 [Candidatus Cloacimonetes bacterium]|nr:hypothetical protein [Candidatus Cloacimonadota bacterium]